MLQIGICDDERSMRAEIYSMCEVFLEKQYSHRYVEFSSGEEVLGYVANEQNESIDLLFLDIEMAGISGIELKDAVMQQNKIWRIVFVTNHDESVYQAFGRKTIGFIPKPPQIDDVSKMLSIVMDELKENIEFTIAGYDGKVRRIKLEDIIYMKADGSYTEIITCSGKDAKGEHFLSTKKIGELEKEMSQYDIMRVHKSYMVNLFNVLQIGQEVILDKLDTRVPIGRAYRQGVKETYLVYVKKRIKSRL